jgi:adenylate cyclase
MDSDVDGWEQSGLYRPEEDGAEERLALLEYLTQRGATLEQMMEAHHLGGLPGVAGDLVMRSDAATISVGEVAARCGLTEQKVQRVLLAAGLPMTADSKVPEDLGALMSAFEQGADLMGEEAILAFTRVLGAAATNIAEAAVALFYAELGPGTGREGSDELARARVSEMATLAFAAVPDALSHILLAQFERATHRAVLARGWSPGVGPIDAPDNQRALMPGPSEIVALGFVDLVGSTSWAEGLSLREHSLALSRFESSAWSSAVLAGGRVVKMIGDEVFFAAPTVDAACRIGSEVCRGAALDALLPPARGAVGHGLVTPREGDYFGPLVNLLLTEEAAASLPADGWSLREMEAQTLRGLERPVRVFAVSPTLPPSGSGGGEESGSVPETRS